MTESEFLGEMQNVMDVSKDVSMDDRLDEYEEWDSLALVTFLSAMRPYTHQKLDTKKVRNAKRIGELYQLVQNS